MTEGTSRCLLVGGPADGRRMNVPDHLRGVWIVERPTLSIKDWLKLEAVGPVEIKHHQYVREFFSTANKRWSVFRWAELTLEDVTEKLIEGYLEPRI